MKLFSGSILRPETNCLRNKKVSTDTKFIFNNYFNIHKDSLKLKHYIFRERDLPPGTSFLVWINDMNHSSYRDAIASRL